MALKDKFLVRLTGEERHELEKLATSKTQKNAIICKRTASSSVSMSPRSRAIKARHFRQVSTEGGASSRMSPP
jgi:hypothetical protein